MNCYAQGLPRMFWGLGDGSGGGARSEACLGLSNKSIGGMMINIGFHLTIVAKL